MSKKIIAIAVIAILIASLIATPVSADRTQTLSLWGYFVGIGDAFSTIYYNAGYVSIGNSLASVATLYVQGLSGSATSTFSVASSSTQKIFDVSPTGTTTIRQYKGFGTPTVSTSTGSGSVAGTSTLAVGSTDLAGSIYLRTGSAPAANAIILSFASASSSYPFCVVSPMSTTTGWLALASSTSLGTTTNGFILKSGTVGLSATTSYQWSYLCN